ncbi:zinc finger protein 85-like isoform X2 [Belonocnema kinseyi]|uniref:zinc finger protein 85-like isoform X2 n=1 Tax=Belonocnema kinseyi TaxID=2817044 RepID=UPI00143D2989|nr:zinc finger protein 85-like isoform X2 [Belonocnema kinseyi]
MTLIKYEIDETLEIKEEIISDQETITEQKLNKKYESKLCSVDTRRNEVFTVKNKLRSHKKGRIQESEPINEYKCEKCARSYKWRVSLWRHKKFECDVMPQFSCKFCAKLFKRKSVRNVHENRVHHNKSSKTLVLKHKCDKCWRSYTWLKDLTRHKNLEHAAVKPLFTCDICGRNMKEKSNLSKHITTKHFKL